MTDHNQPRLTPINEWESEARNILDGVDYDADLGLRMARDAIRVANGELTDAEFHDRYHEAVIEEFGVDRRPTRPEGSEDD
ncbi:hypothetical protein G3I44_09510 [Halogeometricum borinquense]|uniref:4Fe-4S ferredoxin iron-sulfur binding domain-containing protein n=1 Tax=Halogeometricum borinquense TaxID=60847 RepID=A0A6C0UG72_9EURY|nr:4Fe-4S ferredoxin N-terminal domain-containing protein [Halogeometricum borinquense]QIB74494.1 hypothetical protein G3I44_09510 [Halogeometricum borinquense]